MYLLFVHVPNVALTKAFRKQAWTQIAECLWRTHIFAQIMHIPQQSQVCYFMEYLRSSYSPGTLEPVNIQKYIVIKLQDSTFGKRILSLQKWKAVNDDFVQIYASLIKRCKNTVCIKK